MISRPQRETAQTDDTENPYWVSFSDIMAGLMVIFILSLIYLMIQLYDQITLNQSVRDEIKQALQELSRIEEIRKDILEEIQVDLAALDIHIEIVEDNTVLRIPEDQLYFKQGQHTISVHHEHVVATIGEKIYDTIRKGNRLQFIDTIFVEGHTDSVPMRREMGNWGLSSHRAISIWNYWTETPGNLAQLKKLESRNGEAVFSVSGYADTRRVETIERNDEDRRKNRRIDIRFTMHTPEGRDLKVLIDKLENVERATSPAAL
jgi:flagellar motor protein MotB